MTDAATAVVPGHVTGFFTHDPDDDPTVAGSRGAGVTLAETVRVTVRRADEAAVSLNGVDVDLESTLRVLEALSAPAVVSAETDLPLGAGFGVSGAVALGAALGANAVYDRALSVNELVTVAHGAEVQAGTGLGDVVAQARGGVVVRLEPGGPHENVLDAVPAREPLEYYVIDDIDTDGVVDDDTDRITAVGEQSLSRLVAKPTLDRFFEASRAFARESDLLTDDVRRVVQDVAEAGGEATMGMLGETVLARGDGLSAAGYDATQTAIAPCGARLVGADGEPAGDAADGHDAGAEGDHAGDAADPDHTHGRNDGGPPL